MVRRAELVCAEYQQQGYDLTLRQLYYQFVARGWIPNTQQSYKRVGDIVNKARLAGLLDWDYIVDRTRNLRSLSHWSDPGSIIRSAAESFALDKWADQPRRVEVWVEKEALAGIVQRVADEYDVAWFSCRGYVSQSELWGAAQRIGRHIRRRQGVTVLHLGDHDPSGIDMTRDVRDRMMQFLTQDWLNADTEEFEDDSVKVRDIWQSMCNWIKAEEPLEIRRIALNYDQVEQYQPPPNPAKLTDSRANGYIAEHGYESWELDALDPATLADLIRDHIGQTLEPGLFEAQREREDEHRALLSAAAERWGEVAELVGGETA
jgi:hypothetical protein